MKILIYDIQITGHHSEYISHLVNNMDRNNFYYFVIHPDFPKQFPAIYKKGLESPFMNWVSVTRNEIKASFDSNLIKRSFIEIKIIEKYVAITKSSHVIALYFNTLQFALIFKKNLKFTLSGILFLQFTRMQSKSLKEKATFFRKYLITKGYAYNKNIKRIYILNDEKSEFELNKKFKTSIFKVLPDPVPEIEPDKGFDLRKTYGIESDKKIFLLFGALSDRKGVLEAIDALNYLDSESLDKIALLIVGKASTTYYEKIQLTIANLLESKENAKIYFYNEFVTSERMKSIFNQSDIILLPYKNPEASSGILGHAIASSKPVIGPRTGLLGELIIHNKLGVVVNKIHGLHLSESFLKVLSVEIGMEKNSFLERHSDFKFAEKVLSV